MDGAIQQLQRIRQLARLLLAGQRLMQWWAALMGALLIAGLIDYGLRLPARLRLALGILGGVAAVLWLVARLRRAVQFKPELSFLALRAERRYPQLAGVFASSVAFTSDLQASECPATTTALMQRTITEAHRRLGSESLFRLIDPRRTLLIAAMLAGVTIVCVSVVAAAPSSSMLAMERWLNPLGAADWPKRTHIVSLVKESTWADDTPLPVRARVDRGYHRHLRVWVHYWFADAEGRGGPPRRLLLTEQAQPSSDTPDSPAASTVLTRLIEAASEASELIGTRAELVLYFEAGDDRTADQSIRLLPRPRVEEVNVQVEPPGYALGVIDEQSVTWDLKGTSARASNLTVSAMVGSQINMGFDVAGVMPLPKRPWPTVLPGIAAVTHGNFVLDGHTIRASFPLAQTVESSIDLVDRHGLTNMSERVYRIEAIEDQPPAVSIVQPASDEAVLPTAQIGVHVAARDDVAVERLAAEAEVNQSEQTTTLAQVDGRRQQMEFEYDLDLLLWKLAAGDVLTLTAVARDIYDLDGAPRDIRSTPRILRIIDPAELIKQVTNELSAMRRQVIRLESQQRNLMALPLPSGPVQQQQIGRRLESQQTLVGRQSQRLDRNRLDPVQAQPLRQLLEASSNLLDTATNHSQEATEQLKSEATYKSAHVKARQAQGKVRDALTELAALLDQSGDALTLQLHIQELLSKQTDVAVDTRKMLPQTVGQVRSQLSPEQQRALDDLVGRQNHLAEQSYNLLLQMQATSEFLSGQSSEPNDRAAAEALAEAAAIAKREGLKQKMQEAGRLAHENRLSAAGHQQQENLDVLEKMLEQFARQQREQQDMLVRQLARLSEAISKLIEQQEAQLVRLSEVLETAPLAEPMSHLWRNTLAVEAQASAMKKTQSAAATLAQAADHQAKAVTALRGADINRAEDAEGEALARLQEALAIVQGMKNDADRLKQERQRQQLQRAYLELAEHQRELRDDTQPYTTVGKPSRRQRLAVLQLGDQEAELRGKISQRWSEVANTLLFSHMHEQIDQTAKHVVEQLRSAQIDDLVLTDQEEVASLLETMAQALEPKAQDKTFRGQSAGGGGESGAGGAGGPLVPPVAELKLLRGAQKNLNDRTRALSDRAEDGDKPNRRAQRLRQLSRDQRDLADLGEQLISQFQNVRPSAGNRIEP